jgi:lysophospholipase L1-like esterase
MCDQNRISWVAIGDSFTTGVGDYPAAGGWVSRTVRLLRAEDFEIDIDNHAQPGVTIDSVLFDQAPMLPSHATIVSAIAGANDLLIYRYRPATLADHVAGLLERANQVGEIVLTSTCPDFFARRYGFRSKLTRRVDALNDAVRSAAAQLGDRALLLDTHQVLRAERLWHRDGIHPNPLGHRALAAHAADLLRPRLASLKASALPPTAC